MDILDALLTLEWGINEFTLLKLQELVLSGKADDKQQAQYEYINELFVEDVAWTFGDSRGIDDDDEVNTINFKAKEETGYDGEIEPICRIHCEVEKPRTWKKPKEKETMHDGQGVIMQFSKYTLIDTGLSGHTWVKATGLSGKEKIIMDNIDREMCTNRKKRPQKKRKPIKGKPRNLKWNDVVLETYYEIMRKRNLKEAKVAQGEMKNYINSLRK